MPFVIGQASVVKFGNTSGGIVSFSWNQGRSMNPLYQIPVAGDDAIYAVESAYSPTVNVTAYGGCGTPIFTGTDLDVPDCVDSSLAVEISFTPGLCSPVPGFSINAQTFYINSYSFSKDVQGIAQESWSLIGEPSNDFYMMDGTSKEITDPPITTTPEMGVYMINGLVTGQFYGEGVSQAEAGVVLYDSAVVNSEVSVSAGNLSVGEAKQTTQGFVSSFGGSTILKKDGSVCDASINVQYNTVYSS